MIPSRRFRHACPRLCWPQALPACWRDARNRRTRDRSASGRRAHRSRTSARRPAQSRSPSAPASVRSASPWRLRRGPAVSITVNSRSPRRPWPSRRSRVTPGSSSTSASFCPTSRLNSVDLPTFGRPIIAMVNDMKGFLRPLARSSIKVCCGLAPRSSSRPFQANGADVGAPTGGRTCMSTRRKISAGEYRSAAAPGTGRRIAVAPARRAAWPADPAVARWCACERSSLALAVVARQPWCSLPRARHWDQAQHWNRQRRRAAAPRREPCWRSPPAWPFCPWISQPASISALRRAAPRRQRHSADRFAPGKSPCTDPLGTPCSRPGTPSGKTGLRSPGIFFLVSRKSSKSVGSKLLRPTSAAARQRAGKRDNNRGSDQDVATRAWSISHSSVFPPSAFGNRGQQGLQRFDARTEPRRRLTVIGNHVQPFAGRRGIVGAPGRQRQQFSRGVPKGPARAPSKAQDAPASRDSLPFQRATARRELWQVPVPERLHCGRPRCRRKA